MKKSWIILMLLLGGMVLPQMVTGQPIVEQNDAVETVVFADEDEIAADADREDKTGVGIIGRIALALVSLVIIGTMAGFLLRKKGAN